MEPTDRLSGEKPPPIAGMRNSTRSGRSIEHTDMSMIAYMAWQRWAIATVGLIVLMAGLAVAFVPFRVWIENPVPSSDGYNLHCGVPAHTALRRIDPMWQIDQPGLAQGGPDYVRATGPMPQCQPPARRLLNIGATTALAGLMIVALAWGRTMRQRKGATSSAADPVPESNRGQASDPAVP